jgi:hypothetical protein
MKIAVVGNCHVRTLAACLRVLLPHDDIRELWLEVSPVEETAALYEELGSLDLVVSQPLMTGPFAYSELRARARRVILIPQLAFTGFHPDNIVLALVRGPLGSNHSAIIVSSFLLGLSPQRCAKLFNAFVYASLGYFDRFEQAKQHLLQRTQEIGLPLDGHFNSWPRPFMSDVYHPAFEPLASLAELVAARITDRVLRVDWTTSPAREAFTEKRFVAWPIYPEIAARLEMSTEEMRFRYPHTAPGLRLRDFINTSYSVYGSADRGYLESSVNVELPILRDLLASAVVA